MSILLSARKLKWGSILLLMIGLHCLEKKSLKCFAFSLQSGKTRYLQESEVFLELCIYSLLY